MDTPGRLHVEDLALAQACAAGSPAAWDCFVGRFRGRLYAAAMVLAKNETLARELTDSLFGDLFAGNQPCGKRQQPKMASYSGRGSLEGWLKALLTHAYVDQHRAARRMVSLEEHIDILKSACVSQESNQEQTDPRLNGAVHDAFLERKPDERFLLAAYYFDNWTLAEIAGALGIHESSVSRRMYRVLGKLRKSIQRRLQKVGMSPRQIEESFTVGGLELSVDVREFLLRRLPQG